MHLSLFVNSFYYRKKTMMKLIFIQVKMQLSLEKQDNVLWSLYWWNCNAGTTFVNVRKLMNNTCKSVHKCMGNSKVNMWKYKLIKREQ